MAKKLRAGVIGCGSIAQALHLPGYARQPGVALVAACDPDKKRRAEAVGGFGVERTYADYREMLAVEELDVVSVCSPNRFHAEQAVAALQAGAHVLLEKPAALSMKEIDRIKAAVRKSGKILIVGYSHRFHRGNLKAKKLVESGAIGEPYMIRVRFAHMGPFPGWAKSDWFYKPELAGGGALLDMGIHAIDQCLWFCGPVRSVQATAVTLRKDIQLDDNAVVQLEFANGKTLGYIEVGWTSPTGFNGVEIMGDGGSILIDYANGMTLTTGKVTPNLKARVQRKTRLLDPKPTTGGWSIEVAELVKHIRMKSDRGHGIDAGGAALQVALAAYESSRTGRRVKLMRGRG
ncbi:MAG TPA: Gfo/Idh/MocA family oxidoreductase [Phycisphaerae bacterium]|nr:Gfo/Idh/MocA family oxidoreductase [Phycisphaerae bacterium]HOJ73430.1 Gfo/Idh/MocA family oxidoreductase [Phycisphaerae bacterium]HOM51039.1 Gfo/Idh/MocA family oxidoreductase [Phycisphaerae bacterium]HON66312.1 Gfo/Idh/MocA family oxidoreductase [Phycisphaerae bacterium]HOQ85186.1 Gfo/Idh/MocA family oxidoreductase [Phycisphaerae bacterium]